MKAGDLINLLMSYGKSDDVEIKIYETQYIDATAAISVVEEGAIAPTFRINVEAEKLKDFLMQ